MGRRAQYFAIQIILLLLLFVWWVTTTNVLALAAMVLLVIGLLVRGGELGASRSIGTSEGISDGGSASSIHGLTRYAESDKCGAVNSEALAQFFERVGALCPYCGRPLVVGGRFVNHTTAVFNKWIVIRCRFYKTSFGFYSADSCINPLDELEKFAKWAHEHRLQCPYCNKQVAETLFREHFLMLRSKNRKVVFIVRCVETGKELVIE